MSPATWPAIRDPFSMSPSISPRLSAPTPNLSTGEHNPHSPLEWTCLEEMAAAAAFEDSRFPPLEAQELKDLDLEISVLTPLKKVQDIGEIEVGKHGLYIKKGFYAGLLLPQVATEYKWDRVTFLEETCRKAGLPKDAWKEKGTEIYMFSADIF